MALSKFIRLRCLHFCLLLLPCVTNAGESMHLELVETAQQRGALILQDPEMTHPFMDRNLLVRDRRMEAVSFFLLRPVAVGEE